MLATRRCRRSAGISAHSSSRAWQSSPKFWDGLSIPAIAQPNLSKICSVGLKYSDLEGCSILVTLPCWRKSRTTRAWWGVALSWYIVSGISLKYCLANGTKVFRRAYRWGICRGAQEAIWHQYEKLPRRVLNHHQLGPYKPSTFAGSTLQVNDIP